MLWRNIEIVARTNPWVTLYIAATHWVIINSSRTWDLSRGGAPRPYISGSRNKYLRFSQEFLVPISHIFFYNDERVVLQTKALSTRYRRTGHQTHRYFTTPYFPLRKYVFLFPPWYLRNLYASLSRIPKHPYGFSPPWGCISFTPLSYHNYFFLPWALSSDKKHPLIIYLALVQ